MPSSFMPNNEESTRDTLIGRERELRELHAAVSEACAGRGRTLLLVGEPGIGKTRLTSELATYAQQQTVQVLLGRCHEGGGAPPFWPWIQIVRAYLSTSDTDTVRTEMGAGAVDIAQVIPEVRQHLSELHAAVGLDSEQARFRFFDSFTIFLKAAAQRQPLVVILEDLHEADTPSLLLLQFLAREIDAAPLLLVGTYRDLILDHRHPLLQAVGKIVRMPRSQTLSLQKLSKPEVACFLERNGLPVSEPLVTAIYQKTEGNPFFLTEILPLLAAETRPVTGGSLYAPLSIPIPQSVQAAIGQRLQSLSPGCRQVLQLAAVLGREFPFDTLEAVGARFALTPQGDHLVDALEEAIAARLLTAVPHLSGRYSFSHALIHETLYEELSAPRRVRLHRQIANVLEPLYAAHANFALAARGGSRVAELAYHFFHAAQGGQEIAKAVTYARQAGDQAMTVLAYENAAAHYERALQVLALQEVGDDRQRGELLLVLGNAHNKAGAFTLARETFHQAAAVARALQRQSAAEDAAQLLAQAALGMGQGGVYTEADQSLVAVLEEALALAGKEDSTLRARLASRLAAALRYFPQATERSLALGSQAVEMARRLGKAKILAEVLYNWRWVLWRPEYLSEQLVVTRQIVAQAEASGNQELVLFGSTWLWSDLMESGDVEAADDLFNPIDRLMASLRQSSAQWWLPMFRGVRALLDGRFAEAEQRLWEAWALGQRAQYVFVRQLFGAYLSTLARDQGRLTKVEDDLKRFLVHKAGSATQLLWAAWLASELGREAEARQTFALLAAQDFTDIPKDGYWIGSIVTLCEICLFLQDAPRAAALYQFLQPYADHNVLGGVTPATLRGAASRYLGLLATLLSRWEEAEQHFTHALAMNTRMGARPRLADTQSDYAAMLLARNQPGDHAKAHTLLDLALKTAQELGMGRLMQQIERQKAKIGVRDWGLGTDPSSPPTPSLKPQVPSVVTQSSALAPQSSNAFRRDGDYWTLGYEGRDCRLKDAKGLHYLAALVHNPGREFHVLDLLILTDPPPATTAAEEHLSVARRALRVTDESPQTDAQARIAYKSRLQEVKEELEEADRRYDLGRIAALQTERDFLTSELNAAYGFGPHARKGGGEQEQIRKNVTKRIRDVVNRLRTLHPSAWRHFQRSLKTGTFCSYTPEHDIGWEG